MRLIDADTIPKVLDALCERCGGYKRNNECEYCKMDLFGDEIIAMPTIDYLEKQNEPVEPVREVGLYSQYFRCKKCDTLLVVQKQKYCFECGQAVKWDE